MKRHKKSGKFARKSTLLWGGFSLSSAVLMFASVVLMLVSVIRPQSFDPLRIVTGDAFAPIFEIAGIPFQSFSLFLHQLTGIMQLQADNQRLEQENAKLRKWYHVALLLDSENKSLRKLLNMNPVPEYNHIAARVLSDSGNTYAKSLLVAAGKTKNVRKGAAVLSGDGLIGRVIEAGDFSSRVLLVTDINSRVPVVVENTGLHAIMAGTNTDNPRLIHMPKESDIPDGVRVITSGYGGVYPHGLPVGRVKISPAGIYEVMLFSNFNQLQSVKVIFETQKNLFMP